MKGNNSPCIIWYFIASNLPFTKSISVYISRHDQWFLRSIKEIMQKICLSLKLFTLLSFGMSSEFFNSFIFLYVFSISISILSVIYRSNIDKPTSIVSYNVYLITGASWSSFRSSLTLNQAPKNHLSTRFTNCFASST